MGFMVLLAVFFFLIVALSCGMEFGAACFSIFDDFEQERMALPREARPPARPRRLSLSLFREHGRLFPQSHARRRAAVAVAFPILALVFLVWALTR